MPEVRQAIVVDLPRKRLSFGEHKALAERLRREQYGTALIMPRTWKAALAPFLAGIPERVGWVGEWRFGLINDLRFGEKQAPAHGRPMRGARAARRRAAAGELAAAGAAACRTPRSRAGASGWAG